MYMQAFYIRLAACPVVVWIDIVWITLFVALKLSYSEWSRLKYVVIVIIHFEFFRFFVVEAIAFIEMDINNKQIDCITTLDYTSFYVELTTYYLHNIF